MGAVRQIVLTDGRFATIRPIAVKDIIVVYHANPMVMMIGLISRVVTIDDRPVTLAEISEDELSVWFPVLNVLNDELKAILAIGKGVA
jgi:hypothetical protein